MAARDPWAAHLAILRAHWEDDADLSDPAALLAAGVEEVAVARAMAGDVQALFAEATAAATARPIFGSPTSIWEGQMFYGQDRLALLEHALSGR